MNMMDPALQASRAELPKNPPKKRNKKPPAPPAKTFGEELTCWQQACGVSEEEFAQGVSNLMGISQEYKGSDFQQWENGKGLSAKLLDGMVGFIGNSLETNSNPELNFNAKAKNAFYNAALEHFPDIRKGASFDKMLIGWGARAGLSPHEFKTKIDEKAKEYDCENEVRLFFREKEKKLPYTTVEKVVEIVTEVFTEATLNNSLLFRFKAPNKTKLLEAASKYVVENEQWEHREHIHRNRSRDYKPPER